MLDGFIYSAAYEYWGITSPDDNPTKNKPPPIVRRLLTPHEQTKWAYEVASAIRKVVCSMDCLRKYILHLRNQVSAAYERDDWINSTRLNDQYHCPAINCNKSFKTKSGFTKHVSSCHENLSSFVQKPISDVSNELTIGEQNSLVLLLFLIRDLSDAYAMADGDRIFRDIKLAFLYFFNTGHTKYRLWLWRMLAYDIALLSPRKAFEYRWNNCANVNGGISCNIPDDNLVELNVKALKQLLRNQGANVSFESARVTCLCAKYVEAIKNNWSKRCGVKKDGKRGDVDKLNDILTIAQEIHLSRSENVLRPFKDPVLRVTAEALHSWMSEQVLIAKTLLQA